MLYVEAVEWGKILTDPYHDELKELWERYFQELMELKEMLDRHRIDFLVIIYPNIYTVFDRGKNNYQEILIAFFEQHAIDYIDMCPLLKEEKEAFLRHYRLPPRDFHLSAYVKRLMAQKIWQHLKERVSQLAHDSESFEL